MLVEEGGGSVSPIAIERKGYSNSFFLTYDIEHTWRTHHCHNGQRLNFSQKVRQNFFVMCIFAFRREHTSVGRMGLWRHLSERPLFCANGKGSQEAALGLQGRQKDYCPNFRWELISEFRCCHTFVRQENHSGAVHHFGEGQLQSLTTMQVSLGVLLRPLPPGAFHH